MEEVAENVYAVKNITLVDNGFKFAMQGLSDWKIASEEDWGQRLEYIIVEHGTAVTY